MKIKSISLSEFEQLFHNSATRLIEYNEPVPHFNTRYPDRLESCLLTPFMGFGRKMFYKGLTGKASMLFYLFIKSHPFKNGNRRFAIIALLYLLYKNKKWLKAMPSELYDLTKWVAVSDNRLKDETLSVINKYIKINMIP